MSDERIDAGPAREPGPPSRIRAAVSDLLGYLPRGNLLDDATWRRRHTLLRWLLALHAPALLAFGLWLGHPLATCVYVIAPIVAFLVLAQLSRRRRVASFFVTAGVVYCSSALVGLSRGSIEAHFHFFIIVGFIALYQDWVPFLWNIAFTVLSHGLGSIQDQNLIFNHPAGQHDPWRWSLIHGVAVLAACVGMVIFWRFTEDEQQRVIALRTEVAETEVERRRFTSDLLVNLARRNQNLLQRQLSILGELEQRESDPYALAGLSRLDHLTTRIRRNAESLLVLSGEDPPRVWRQPIPLGDVLRAAVAETEDLERVSYEIDQEPAVLGHLVTPLTHLLAELVENATRFSPPSRNVTIRTWDPRTDGTYLLMVEDQGLGMSAEELSAANELLAEPPDVDLSTHRRFGLNVVARLARRHGIRVWLTPTVPSGVTAAVSLPAGIFVPAPSDARPALGEDRWAALEQQSPPWA